MTSVTLSVTSLKTSNGQNLLLPVSILKLSKHTYTICMALKYIMHFTRTFSTYSCIDHTRFWKFFKFRLIYFWVCFCVACCRAAAIVSSCITIRETCAFQYFLCGARTSQTSSKSQLHIWIMQWIGSCLTQLFNNLSFFISRLAVQFTINQTIWLQRHRLHRIHSLLKRCISSVTTHLCTLCTWYRPY